MLQVKTHNSMATLGSRLKEARIDRGLSQPELAHKSGVGQTVISKLENGDIKKTAAIVALSLALNVDSAWLQFGVGDITYQRKLRPRWNWDAVDLILRLGGVTQVANMFGLTRPRVSKWKKEGIPKEEMQRLVMSHPALLEGVGVEAATASEY